MRSSFASIAILVFESLQRRSAIRQAACEWVRVRLRTLGGIQCLGLIRSAAVCTTAHPHVAGGMEAVHKQMPPDNSIWRQLQDVLRTIQEVRGYADASQVQAVAAVADMQRCHLNVTSSVSI